MADKPKRNDPCPCGSGKKYKNCCYGKDQSPLSSNLGTGGIVGIVVAIIIGLLILGKVLTDEGGRQSGGGPQDCPPGQVWSEEHGHCH